jgi:uncharacterized membrane protein YqiK
MGAATVIMVVVVVVVVVVIIMGMLSMMMTIRGKSGRGAWSQGGHSGRSCQQNRADKTD